VKTIVSIFVAAVSTLGAFASVAVALAFGGVTPVVAMSNVQMGEVRYLAADGDDARDGKTPETAWRTLSRLNDGLPSGGTALLRCGDVFFGQLAVSGGIDKDRRTVITSYGVGSKPVISGTKNLRDDPGIWHVHFTPDRNRLREIAASPASYTLTLVRAKQ